MAETQTQPVSTTGVEIQEGAVKAPYIYYYSDPDATDPRLHHLEIPSFVDITKSPDGLPWHWHTEKPDESLVDAIWSNEANGWVENSKNAQTDIIAQAQKAIASLNSKSVELDKKNDQVDATLQEVQEVQVASSKQNAQLMQQFMTQTKATNDMMKSVQSTLTALSKSVAALQPTEKAEDSKATQEESK